MKDFFISYNSADRQWAEWIAWQLEEAGYKVEIQVWDSQAGKNFIEWMDKASKNTRQTIAVLSPSYLKGKFSMAEWTAALYDEKLLPIRIQDFDVKGLFGPIVYIDLVGLEEEKAKEKLLKDVRLERKKPLTAPRFPEPIQHTIIKPTRFPGALPPIWNVPYNRNPNFTGRENLLGDLRESLVVKRSSLHVLAIYGLGGIGKTQLALEYIYSHIDEYEIIWWIRAEDAITLANDYANLASKLEFPENSSRDQSVIIAAVRSWLDHNLGWLLIFDNADEVDSVRPFLPQGNTGHVLITSRNPNWADVAKTFKIDKFSPHEAIDFLCKQTGYDDKVTAKSLSEMLGKLPLALAQASAYIKKGGKSFADYVEKYIKYEQKILERGKLSTGYEHTVATTWEISFEQVKDRLPAAVDLLNLCGFLAPDDIPRDLISEGIKNLSEVKIESLTDPLTFDDAVIELRNYSLIDATNESLSVHRLVQAVTRERLANDDKKEWAKASALLMDLLFPIMSADVKYWPKCDRLQSHALVSTMFAEQYQVALENVSSLLRRIGSQLWAKGNFSQAESLLRRAMTIAEKRFKYDDPIMSVYLNELANALRSQGKYSAAELHYRRALEIEEKVSGSESLDVALILNNLAAAIRDQEKFSEAEIMIGRSLKIREQILGREHHHVAACLSNLSVLLKMQGKYAKAESRSRQSLDIVKKNLGIEHPTTALNMNRLAELLVIQENLGEAESLFHKALQILESKYGSDHPKTKEVQKNLENLFKKKTSSSKNL